MPRPAGQYEWGMFIRTLAMLAGLGVGAVAFLARLDTVEGLVFGPIFVMLATAWGYYLVRHWRSPAERGEGLQDDGAS